MENVIKVYPYGTKVKVNVSGLEGQIISAIIEQNKVVYSIFYYDKNASSYATVLIGEELFKVPEKNTEKQAIGFK